MECEISQSDETAAPRRIVSLLAAASEIVCALGAGDRLVGRSHECNHPESIGELPACTRAAFNTNLASGRIDAEVRRRLAAGEPLFHLDTELIGRLKPDLILAQAHCDVCAVTPAGLAQAGQPMKCKVVSLAAGSVAGIFDDMRRVAQAMAIPAAGEELVARVERQIAAVRRAVEGRPVVDVLVLEWIDPLFAMGNWGPELVAAAGGRPLLAAPGQYSRTVSWHEIQAADADYLIIAPCGFGLERTRRELTALESLSGWNDLKAVRQGHVALADGDRYFNRSGVTIGDTAEILAEILHGDGRGPWRGTAWEPAGG